ncbi:MAG: substrate-binding domain-containing protein [Longimicrobiales bacterium]
MPGCGRLGRAGNVGALLAAVACGGSLGERSTLGATTTLEDSGLLDLLIEGFANAGGARPRVIVGGTGDILAMLERGDIDVALTHDSVAETRLVERGSATERHTVMRSTYQIVGPPADPAGVSEAGDAIDAFRRIADAGAPFVSRGDDSGTHRRELALWRGAGVELQRGGATPHWYIEAGIGMADALRLAMERDAYALADRPTWLRTGAAQPALFTDDRRLANPYGLTISKRAAQSVPARRLADWLRSADAARRIRTFGGGTEGRPLFVPARDHSAH